MRAPVTATRSSHPSKSPCCTLTSYSTGKNYLSTPRSAAYSYILVLRAFWSLASLKHHRLQFAPTVHNDPPRNWHTISPWFLDARDSLLFPYKSIDFTFHVRLSLLARWVAGRSWRTFARRRWEISAVDRTMVRHCISRIKRVVCVVLYISLGRLADNHPTHSVNILPNYQQYTTKRYTQCLA